MKYIHLVSLGCAKNRVDSEQILAMFPPERFSLTMDPSKADLIIVNTCAFIEKAKVEAIETIFEMAKNPGKVFVTGCLAERYEKELKDELNEVDSIIPIRDYGDLAKKINEVFPDERIFAFNPLRRRLTTSKGSAYLRISDGCDNFCAFCAIPFIRGRFVSRPFEEVLQDARQLKESGVKEISIISQDTTVYGKDLHSGKPCIVELLKELEKIGFFSIRLLYLYPSEVDDELIDLIASSKTIAHYFDIPVQAASDHMLLSMRRHADAKKTIALFHRIKERCPDAILRTTFITGFPGESEEDHQETLAMLEEIRFHHVGVFTYSPEEGTAGARMEGQIDEDTKIERMNEIMAAERPIAYKLNLGLVGKRMEGIVYDIARDGSYLVRTYWNAPDDIDGSIRLRSDRKFEVGDIVRIKIVYAYLYDLMAELDE